MLNSGKKINSRDVNSRTQGVSHVIYIIFLDLLQVRYNCVMFHHCKICVTDFTEGCLFASPPPWAAPKRPILNRVKKALTSIKKKFPLDGEIVCNSVWTDVIQGSQCSWSNLRFFGQVSVSFIKDIDVDKLYDEFIDN